MNFQDIQQALDLFGLGERATLSQIKSRHRLLVKKHHPDKNIDHDEMINLTGDSKIKEINEAYQTLSAYCNSYRYSFSKDEFMRQCPEEYLKEQFSNDPVWSTGAGES